MLTSESTQLMPGCSSGVDQGVLLLLVESSLTLARAKMTSTVWNIIWTWHVRCNLAQTQTTHTQKNVLYLVSQQASNWCQYRCFQNANSYSFPPTPFHVKAISEQRISILHWGWRHFLPAAAHQWQPQGWFWSHVYFLRFLSEGIWKPAFSLLKMVCFSGCVLKSLKKW